MRCKRVLRAGRLVGSWELTGRNDSTILNFIIVVTLRTLDLQE